MNIYISKFYHQQYNFKYNYLFVQFNYKNLNIIFLYINIILHCIINIKK